MKFFLHIFFFLISYDVVAQSDTVIIKGIVNCDIYNEPVQNAELSLKLSGGYTFFQKTDTSGRYEFKLKIDTSSRCSISITSKYAWSRSVKQGCFLYCNDVGTAELQPGTEYIKDFKLTRAYHCGEKHFSPLIFNTNSIVSCNDSLNKIDSTTYYTFNKTINELYDVLKTNPTIIIEFQGHASTLEKNHELLSLYRAQLIGEVLIAKGIDKRRIQAKGWGNHKPLIKDDYIKKRAITKEENAALHLKNQRVVFRIISWDYIEEKK